MRSVGRGARDILRDDVNIENKVRLKSENSQKKSAKNEKKKLRKPQKKLQRPTFAELEEQFQLTPDSLIYPPPEPEPATYTYNEGAGPSVSTGYHYHSEEVQDLEDAEFEAEAFGPSSDYHAAGPSSAYPYWCQTPDSLPDLEDDVYSYEPPDARPQPTAGEPSLNEAPLQLSTAGFEETQPQFGVGKPSHDKTQPQLDVNRPSHEETQHQLGVGRPRLDETQPQFGVSGPRLDKAQPQSSSGGLGFESALSCARWGPPLPRYKLSTIQHGALTDDIQKLLKKVFITNNYDSVNNFILFYDTYVKTGGSLLDFFKKYDAPLRPKQYTCVGLGLDLIRRMKSLECTFPGLSQSTSLLSCEESVNNNVDDYVQLAEGPHKVPFVAGEKEHVMVGVQIEIDGRKGVMIADPGYHVGKVVTVMIDGGYPHTGSFVQSRNIHLIKEYNYFINPKNPNYVEWHERQLKLQKMKNLTSLIFISRPFITAIEVSEKRNLVYSFKSHMNRDKRGNIVAGYFFPISSDFDKATFNVFIGVSSRAKYYFKYFSDPRNIPEGLVEKVDMISKFMYCSTRFLMETICKLAKVLADRNFVDQMLAIDNDIKLKTKARFPNADVVPPVDPNAAISLLRDVGMITNYAARLRYKVAITEADEDDKKLIVDIIEDRQKALEADFELENPNKPSCSSNR